MQKIEIPKDKTEAIMKRFDAVTAARQKLAQIEAAEMRARIEAIRERDNFAVFMAGVKKELNVPIEFDMNPDATEFRPFDPTTEVLPEMFRKPIPGVTE